MPYRDKKKQHQAITKWHEKTKKKCIEYKGGKCSRCGYNKCDAALEFHHIDPEQKSFGLSRNHLGKKWEILKAELDKTILLCSNCHREIQYAVFVQRKDSRLVSGE